MLYEGTSALPCQMEYTRLIFGIAEAGTAFAKITQKIFNKHGFFPFVDDIGNGSQSIVAHIAETDRLFRVAAHYNVSFALEKSKFFQQRMNHLGHCITQQGLTIDEERIRTINEMKAPKNLSQLRSLIGSVNFVMQYLGSAASTWFAPLTDLMKTSLLPFAQRWSYTQEEAFKKLKDAVCSPAVLKIYDSTLPCKVITDGSTVGVGACLWQLHPNGTWYLCSTFSRKLNATQQNWDTSHHELYALVLAIHKWRPWLADKHFLVETDHAALLILQEGKLFASRRLVRWQLFLSEFRFSVKHSKDIALEDTFSRLHLIEELLRSHFGPGSNEKHDTETSEAFHEAIINTISEIEFADFSTLNERTCGSAVSGDCANLSELFNPIHQNTELSASAESLGITYKCSSGDAVISTIGLFPIQVEGKILCKLPQIKGKERYLIHFDGQGKNTNATLNEDFFIKREELIMTISSNNNMNFEKGDNVICSLWKPHLYHGTVKAVLKSDKSEIEKGEYFYKVEFDDGEFWNVNGDSLKLCPSNKETPPVEDSTVTTKNNTANTLPILQSTTSNPSIKSNKSNTNPRNIAEGDLVLIQIGGNAFITNSNAQHGYSLRAVVTEINDSTVTTRLLVKGEAIVSLPIGNVKLMCKSNVFSTGIPFIVRPPDVGLLEGDVVAVKPGPRPTHIVNEYLTLGMDFRPAFIQGYLIGTIIKRVSAHVYTVHFGDYENGAAKFTTNELVLLSNGRTADTRTSFGVSLPHPLTAVERALIPVKDIESAGLDFAKELINQLVLEINSDPVTRLVIDILMNKQNIFLPGGETTHNEKQLLRLRNIIPTRYKLSPEGILLYSPKNQRSLQPKLIIVPRSFIPSVIRLCHESTSLHQGFEKTLSLTRTFFHFHDMSALCKSFCSCCHNCNLRVHSSAYREHIGSRAYEQLVGANIGEVWHADLLKLPTDKLGYKYLLLLIDRGSRKVIDIIMKDKRPATVARHIQIDFITKHGRNNTTIITDKGTDFVNDVNQIMFSNYGINPLSVGERTPNSNGLIERVNQNVNRYVSLALIDHALDMKQWSWFVPQVISIYNDSIHPELETTPNLLYMNMAPRINSSSAFVPVLESIKLSNSKKRTVHEQAMDLANRQEVFLAIRELVYNDYSTRAEMVLLFKDAMSRFYEKELVSIFVSDMNNSPQTKHNANLGPFQIVRQINDSTYSVKGLDGIEVPIQGWKLIKYNASVGHLYNRGHLAYTATGVAWDRMIFRGGLRPKSDFDFSVLDKARQEANDDDKDDSDIE